MSNVIRYRRLLDSRLNRAMAKTKAPAKPRRLLYWVVGVLFIVVYVSVLL